MTTSIITKGNQAVIVRNQNGHFMANLYVNVRSADRADWDITNLRWSGKTMKGAEKWAAKQLSA